MDAVGFALASQIEPYRWKRISALPFPDGEVRVEVVGNKAYVLSRNYNQVYDFLNNRWEQESPMPDDRRRKRFSTCVVGTKIYVLAGADDLDDIRGDSKPLLVDIYDTVTKTWSIGPGTTTNSFSSGCVAFEGKIYLFGGSNQYVYGVHQTIRLARVLDVSTGQWSSLTLMDTALSEMGAAAYSGKIYLFGGYTVLNNSTIRNNDTIFVYDPASGTWAAGPKLYSKRTPVESLVVGSEIFILGGAGAVIVESYAPQNNQVTVRQSPTTIRTYFGAAYYGGAVYAFGGDAAGSVDVFYPNGTNMNALLAWLATR